VLHIVNGTSNPAREGWAAVYSDLSADKPGLLGAVTARAEAQTIRLAMIYALLDGQRQIDVVHLQAALAVWEFCEAPAQRIFGQMLGDSIADDILRSLKCVGENGLTRTNIRELFGRHQPAPGARPALSDLPLVRGAEGARHELVIELSVRDHTPG
jgi:hypothetical protein